LLIGIDCLAETLHSFEQVMSKQSREEFIEFCFRFGAHIDQISKDEHSHVFRSRGRLL